MLNYLLPVRRKSSLWARWPTRGGQGRTAWTWDKGRNDSLYIPWYSHAGRQLVSTRGPRSGRRVSPSACSGLGLRKRVHWTPFRATPSSCLLLLTPSRATETSSPYPWFASRISSVVAIRWRNSRSMAQLGLMPWASRTLPLSRSAVASLYSSWSSRADEAGALLRSS